MKYGYAGQRRTAGSTAPPRPSGQSPGMAWLSARDQFGLALGMKSSVINRLGTVERTGQ